MKEKIKSYYVQFHGAVFYVFFGLVIAGLVFFVWTNLISQWGEIVSLRTTFREISQEVSDLDKAVSILKAVDKTQLAKDLSSVNAALPSQKKTSGLVKGITSTASASGVVVRELEFSPGKISTDSASTIEEMVSGSRARAIKANLMINTDLSKLSGFLTKVQQANQLLGVTGINFTGAAGKEPMAQLSLQVFYQPLPTGAIIWREIRPVSPDERQILQSLNSPDIFIVPEEGR